MWGEMVFFTSLAIQGREAPCTSKRHPGVKFVGSKQEVSRVFSVKGQRVNIFNVLGPQGKNQRCST